MLVSFEKNDGPIGQKLTDWPILKRIAHLVAGMAQSGVYAQLGCCRGERELIYDEIIYVVYRQLDSFTIVIHCLGILLQALFSLSEIAISQLD